MCAFLFFYVNAARPVRLGLLGLMFLKTFGGERRIVRILLETVFDQSQVIPPPPPPTPGGATSKYSSLRPVLRNTFSFQ